MSVGLTVLPWCRVPTVKAVIHQTLPVLRDLVDSISGESTKSRQICYQSLQESVQVSLSLFPVFIQQSGQRLKRRLSFYFQAKGQTSDEN